MLSSPVIVTEKSSPLGSSDAERAKRAETALARLTDLTLALSGTATANEVTELIVEHGMRNANADTATLYVLDEATQKLRLAAHRGVAPEIIEKIGTISATEGNPGTFETFRQNRSVWAETAKDYAAIFPKLAATQATGKRAKAFWSVPLVVEDRPIGLLGVGFFEEQEFTPQERALVDTFAKQCAQALSRAQHATVEKRQQARRDFLARAGVALSTSLDYRATLSAVATFAVPQLADWCTIDVVEPGHRAPRQVALAHVDPAKIEWARKLGERYPPDPTSPRGAANVIRTGKSELYAEIPSELLERGAQDDEHLRIIRELRLRSAMIVPLRGREETLGAMTFLYADSGRRYADDDVAFAEEFARRAAMAIENARALQRADEANTRERALRNQAEIANQSKDEFLATVSHELRTPLNAILGWTVILREKSPPAEIDQGLAVIERNARRQARLIEDILDVSRIISGKLSLTLRHTNIAEVIDAAMDAVNAAAGAKGVSLEVDVDKAIDFNADGDRLQQIVWNLLSNAVKFTPKDGTIAVRAFREGSDICISVTDTGQGIPISTLPHVFERFHQADASTTRKHGGLGLGLAIVKQLVAAHGGSVSALSEGEGKGATFVVRVPSRSVASVVDVRIPSEDPPSVEARVAPRLDGLKILVVDDEPDARQLVKQVLSMQGAIVTEASSAAAALAVIAEMSPDVIVSDIGMPDRDGYALMQEIRTFPLHRGGRTPAVALTAYATKADAERALAAGFQAHAAKPVEPAWLCTLVANVSGRTTN